MTITNWRKPSRSQTGGNCVETGWTAHRVGYRDSKHAGPTLTFDHTAAAAFVQATKHGEFDRA